MPLHLGDWFQFWYAGHLVATGVSPYDPGSWLEAARAYGPAAHGFAANTYDGIDPTRHLWLYPPWTGLMLAPFGALPLEVGIPAMHGLLLALGVADLLLSVRLLAPRSSSVESLLLAGGAASMPFVIATRTGHFTAVLMLGTLLVASGLRRDSARRVAFGAALLALKPHLFLAFGPIVVVWLARSRRWRALLATAGALAVVAVLGLAISPMPLGSLGASGAKLTFDVATIWALAALVAPGPSPWLAGAACALASWLAWRAVAMSARPVRPIALVTAATTLSIVVAPYVQTYDFLLLVPGLVVSVTADERRDGFERSLLHVATTAILVLLPWIVYFVALAGAQAVGAVVPLAAIVVMGLAPRRPPTARTQT